MQTASLMLTVRGTPRGRPTARPGGHVARMLDRNIKGWRNAIEKAARIAVEAGNVPPPGGVSVELVFSFQTQDTGRHGRPHTAKPDSDNLAKIALDAMVKAGALGGDDARAADLRVRKVWAAEGGMIAVVRALVWDGTGSERKEEAPAWMAGAG